MLGNGDIWEARDALRMMGQTGCDGVVVGRGCLGRPWLFRDLADVFAGRPVQPPPRSARWPPVMLDHAERLVGVERRGGRHEVVPQARRLVPHRLPGRRPGAEAANVVATLADLDDLLDGLDPDAEIEENALRAPGATPTARGASSCRTAGSTGPTTPPPPRAPSSSCSGG